MNVVNMDAAKTFITLAPKLWYERSTRHRVYTDRCRLSLAGVRTCVPPDARQEAEAVGDPQKKCYMLYQQKQ